MKNEFGYDESAPNAPWHSRDVLRKCECGNMFAGTYSSTCGKCETVDINQAEETNHAPNVDTRI